MPLRFEINYDDSSITWENLVDEVFNELTSSFIEMPQGEGFVDYATFEKGYQELKRRTDAFADFTTENVLEAVRAKPIAFIVLRCILGFTPPEWGYLTTEKTGVEVNQGSARAIDRKFRLNPFAPMDEGNGVTGQRIHALIETAVSTVAEGAGKTPPGFLHRLDKADTAEGSESLQSVAELGVPYPVLLYERFLGRPFASHKDSVSELVGEVVEAAVKNILTEAKISFREEAGRKNSRLRSDS